VTGEADFEVCFCHVLRTSIRQMKKSSEKEQQRGDQGPTRKSSSRLPASFKVM
jgi:hypothetical protein